MGLFKRQDELFEIMAKSRNKGPDGEAPPRPTPKRPPTVSNALARYGPGPAVSKELVEVDGDALIVVDDEDWGTLESEPTAPVVVGTKARPESDGMQILSLRADTAIVGGILLAGVIAGAFLLGRTSSEPESASNKTPVALVVQTENSSVPAATPQESGATTVVASVDPSQTSTMRAGAPRTPAAQTAESAEPVQQVVAKPKHELIVVSTSEVKAVAVAKWLNESPLSPIVGRKNLEAFARRGTVRVRGFFVQDDQIRKRIHNTPDPTNGGSGTFHDAYYVKVKR